MPTLHIQLAVGRVCQPPLFNDTRLKEERIWKLPLETHVLNWKPRYILHVGIIHSLRDPYCTVSQSKHRAEIVASASSKCSLVFQHTLQSQIEVPFLFLEENNFRIRPHDILPRFLYLVERLPEIDPPVEPVPIHVCHVAGNYWPAFAIIPTWRSKAVV